MTCGEAASRVLDGVAVDGGRSKCVPTIPSPAARVISWRIYGNRTPDLTPGGKAGPEALQGADAPAIVTEWREFRSPDLQIRN